MGDWIDNEMETFRSEKEREQQEQSLINYANYWADLIRQIERDIEKISHLPDFQNVLRKGVLRFVSFGTHYQIQMTTTPKMSVTIRNGGQSISVRTIIDGIDDESDKEENLQVVDRSGRFYLQLNGKEYLVPEQASEFIVRPILEELKKALSNSSFFDRA